jgi:Ca2+/Na+ antiporter
VGFALPFKLVLFQVDRLLQLHACFSYSMVFLISVVLILSLFFLRNTEMHKQDTTFSLLLLEECFLFSPFYFVYWEVHQVQLEEVLHGFSGFFQLLLLVKA